MPSEYMSIRATAINVICIFLLAGFRVVRSDRTFTVANNCTYTVWPAILGGSTVGIASGWEAAAGTSVSFSVPEDWDSGRLWGRIQCDFSNSSATETCVSGSCSGGLECTADGALPATLAEFTLSADGLDYYDVSLVDGFNLPLMITTNVDCHSAGCTVDLDSVCPSVLDGPKNSSGAVLGCYSACAADLSGDSSNSPDCCTGDYSTANTCPNSGVEYYTFFKDNCPDTYCYAYDESSGTALWTCDSSLGADYTITFCPTNNDTTTTSASGSVSAVSSTIGTLSTGTATSTSAAASQTATKSTGSGPQVCRLKYDL